MKRLKKNRFDKINILLAAIGTAFVNPATAYASGDPVVLFWIGGWLLLDITLFTVLFVKERNQTKKNVKLTIYSLVLILLWAWGMSIEGPDFTFSNIVMSIFPVIMAVLLLKI